MQFNVSDRTIYLVKHGSHAYGTNTPESDLDIKGICIPPAIYYTGYLYKFEQEEQMAHKGYPHDKVTYSIEKFFKLAADCNPNIIEVLNVDDSDVMHMDSFGQRLRNEAHRFLSKKARFTFAGYAHAQLKRIDTHRRWLLDSGKFEGPAPSREKFDLPPLQDGQKAQIEAAFSVVQKKLDEWNIDMMGMDDAQKINLQQRMSEMFAGLNKSRDHMWTKAAEQVFADTNLIYALQKERQYANALSDWQKYQDWKKSRNASRASLEAKFGYDTKHGGHLIRLMRMCKEILEGKGVIVKRPDAQEILAIRHGIWTYEQLITESNRLEALCDELYKTSTIPHKPDHEFLNSLCSDMIVEYHRKFG